MPDIRCHVLPASACKPNFQIQCLAARNAVPQFSSPQSWFQLSVPRSRKEEAVALRPGDATTKEDVRALLRALRRGPSPLRATGPLSLTLPIRPPASPHPFAPLSIVCYLPGGAGHATDGRCPHGDIGLLLPAASSRGCGQGKAPALRPGQVGSQWLCNDDGRLVAASVGGRACGVGLRHRP
jgi:hypothetical protein